MAIEATRFKKMREALSCKTWLQSIKSKAQEAMMMKKALTTQVGSNDLVNKNGLIKAYTNYTYMTIIQL